jgi:phosphopantothenoylcysteine decarboxylase/phosphopantothenate--cysteine ligase
MFNAVKRKMRAKKFDIVILSAAAADYTVNTPSKSKIKSTHRNIVIKLRKAPKIIDQIKKFQKDVFLVGFKAETNVSKKELVRSAIRKLREADADMIVANDVGAKYQNNPELNEIVLVYKDGKIVSTRRLTKLRISKFIRKQIEQRFT